jgi:hypothetical protein
VKGERRRGCPPSAGLKTVDEKSGVATNEDGDLGIRWAENASDGRLRACSWWSLAGTAVVQPWSLAAMSCTNPGRGFIAR